MTDPTLHIQRAQMLLQTDRMAEADKELRTALSIAPEYAYPHALLSLCLSRQLKHEAAFQEAKAAIALDPDNAVYYYFYSECLLRAKRFDESRQTVEHAIALDPDDADFYYMRAAIELEKNERKAARDSLLRALEINPEHENSLALLARVQAVLGETGDAEQLARMAVRNRPESSDAHIARGYALLYAGREKESFDAFREALRLDPNNEAARSGLLEALKIHNIFYRLLFQFFVFMSRLSAKYQWALIIGLIVGARFLRGLLQQMPALAPIIVPLLTLYMLFCFATWLADPIIYTTLWISRWGRLAMTLREKMVGVATVLIGMGIVVCFVAFLMTTHVFLLPLAFGLLLLLLPVTKAIHSDHVMLSITISAITIVFIAISILMQKPEFFGYAGLAFVAWLLLVNYMAIQRSAPRD